MFIHGREKHIFSNRMFFGWEYIMFHGHCTDNKKFGLHLRKRRKTLVQTVKVVLGSVSQFWSKTCGSVCENLWSNTFFKTTYSSTVNCPETNFLRRKKKTTEDVASFPRSCSLGVPTRGVQVEAGPLTEDKWLWSLPPANTVSIARSCFKAVL